MGGGGRGGREGLYASPMYELSSSVWSVVRRERYSLPDTENCLVGVGGPSVAGCSLGSWVLTPGSYTVPGKWASRDLGMLYHNHQRDTSWLAIIQFCLFRLLM